MGSFSGAFQYLDERGAEMQSGPCKVTIEPPNLFTTPQTGPSLSIDLGDIDFLDSGDYQLTLRLYTGKSLVLTRFAKTFQNLSEALLGAHRDRLVQCLLLDDLEEIDRFEGHVEITGGDRNFSNPAQLRLYKSNLAILPMKEVGFQWRLADMDGTEFDDAAYRFIIRSGHTRLSVGKLAKRTSEFVERLRAAIDVVSENTAAIVRSLCPFLSPDQALEVSRLMKEGRATGVLKLRQIHPEIEQSLVAHAVDPALRPYFDALKQETGSQEWFAGFKMVRPEMEPGPERVPSNAEPGAPPVEGAQADGPIDERSEGDRNPEVLYWFFFPIKAATASDDSNVIAWESTSLSGRATYFFNTSGALSQGEVHDRSNSLEASVRQLNQALVMLNFRREPVYLPDTSLQTEARYRRYAIACRKLSILRELRASYLGRAIHTSVDAWQNQVDAILTKT